jgi:2'-5' RNA ligase
MDTAEIERIRLRWDPLAGAVPAHITVAFPFEWSGHVSTLADTLLPVLASVAPFAVTLAAPTIWEGEYLFLLVEEGSKQVRRLHESVYGLALPGVRRPSRFVPHMTVGRQAETTALAAGITETAAMDLPLFGTARSLTAYRRDEDGRRVRELDLPFGAGS